MLVLEASQDKARHHDVPSLFFKKAQCFFTVAFLYRLFQVIDLFIALCLAKITVLHRKEQVHMLMSTIYKVQSSPLLLLATAQVDVQVTEQGSYGNGVESILVKEDPSLPLFVAIA